MPIDVQTFGCRLNTVESEVMKKRATEAGLENAILFNTCAVTGEAVRQARQAIRRARRENPGARIIVSGCGAQTDPAMFAEMDEVDLVLGNAEKLTAAAYTHLPKAGPDFGIAASEKVFVNDIMSVRETAGHLLEGLEGRTRAFVQIQNGCDHRCTFCIIPYGRGPSRSVPMGEAVSQIRRLVENGYREVVLSGVDMTSWGQDLPGTPRLGRLIGAILTHVPELDRLRLSSIDSIEVDEELMRLIAEDHRIMPHLHLSLQAGDNMILKRMKRRHAREDSIRFCADMRKARPDMVFGADLIAGFPTETEEMFLNTLAIIEDCGLTHLHVFPFSARPGTPAAKIPPVEKSLVKERAARLRAAGEAALAAHLASEIGKTRKILIEKPGLGRTEHFTLVEIEAGEPGEIIPALITGHTPRALQARRNAEAARA